MIELAVVLGLTFVGLAVRAAFLDYLDTIRK